jgi:hypothetical protein
VVGSLANAKGVSKKGSSSIRDFTCAISAERPKRVKYGVVGFGPQHTIAAVVQRRPLRRQPNDHNFGSTLTLAVTAGLFLSLHGSPQRHFVLPARVSHPVKDTVAAFASAYEAPSPDAQTELRVWMRKIVSRGKTSGRLGRLTPEHFCYDKDQYRSAQASAQE